MAKQPKNLDPLAGERLELELVAAGLPVRKVLVPAPQRPLDQADLVERPDVDVAILYTTQPTQEQQLRAEELVLKADLRVRTPKSLAKIAGELIAGAMADSVVAARLDRAAAALTVAGQIQNHPLWGLRVGLGVDGAEAPAKPKE